MPLFADFDPHVEQYKFSCEDRDECEGQYEDPDTGEIKEFNEIFCQPDRADLCENNEGSFACHCSNGYINSTENGGQNGCGDVNECNNPEIRADCLSRSVNPACVTETTLTECIRCQNTMGSYMCGCDIGTDFDIL